MNIAPIGGQVANSRLPIGVFDSGVGGLTVLAALRRELPGESLVYLGDTARVPYGTKSSASVIRYAQQAASLLVNGGIKLLVVACNTASAVGLEALRKHFAHLPVIGVVEPGAQASCAVSRNGRIAVIGTEGTILGGAYQRAITDIRPDALVVAQPCSLFVALAEEGWIEGELVEAIISKYLTPILRREASDPIDCMVLGCTHFPALSGAIQNVVGQTVKLVDSAETTAKAVKRELNRLGLLAPADASDAALTRFLVTDGPDRFSRVAPHFFHSPVPLSLIELVDIGTTA